MTTDYIEGQALVASPFLLDRNFRRTVVYIVKHDEDGAYGLILNRPMNVSVGSLLKKILQSEIDNEDPIYHGGPVEGPVVIVHEHPAYQSSLIAPGISLATETEDFLTICTQSESRSRVFSGYAGWAPGQLEDELKQGGWLVWKLEKDDIFADADDVWQKAVRQIGRQIISDSIHIAQIPNDPSVN